MGYRLFNLTNAVIDISDIGLEIPAFGTILINNQDNLLLADSNVLKSFMDLGSVVFKLDSGFILNKGIQSGFTNVSINESIEIQKGSISTNTKYEKQGGYIRQSGFIKGSQ